MVSLAGIVAGPEMGAGQTKVAGFESQVPRRVSGFYSTRLSPLAGLALIFIENQFS